MPIRDTDEEGEDYPYLDAALEKAYQKKRQKWLDRNACAYSYLIEACINHEDAKLVVVNPQQEGA